MMSTENGVTSFHTKEKIFHNWTKGEGLLPAYFNASSGVLRKIRTLYLVVRTELSNFPKM